MSTMINLLPPDIKEAYRYGRRNRALLHWITSIVFCLAGAVALTTGGYLYLQHTINENQRQVSDSQQQLKDQNQADVQKQVTAISNNLKLATQVLSKEILFSELLKRLAAVTPRDTILTGLSITQIQGSVDISAQTTDYPAATQLQTNLADPKNQIFSKADIETISCGGSSNNASYPCSVTIRALFAANNPFLFINNQKGGS
jgi:type IV pilus assembly PilN-like protein